MTDVAASSDITTATPDRAGRGSADLDAQTAAADPGAVIADAQLIDDIEEALKDVVDPELGINIVDLGLVYDLNVDGSGKNIATIDMTLTSAACPLTEMIEEQVSAALVGGPTAGSSRTSGSTGSGCRHGVRKRSPKTAGNRCAPSASTSELACSPSWKTYRAFRP